MRKLTTLFLLLTAFVAHAAPLDDTRLVILKTDADGQCTVSGNATLESKPFPPASTFKVLITWAGLAEGLVTPETKRRVTDAFVPGAPRELSLHEALYFSSNDYFNWLGKRLGREKLEHYIAKSGYAGGTAPKGWFSDPEQIKAGGTIRITPRQNHDFMLRVARGKLGATPEVQAQLLQAMRWPCVTAGRKIYGKTGSMSGVLWFNGFMEEGGRVTVITVLAQADVDARPALLQRAYAELGETFDLSWLKAYPLK